jgi:cell division protein YceG involved in septum cleavage
MKTRLTTIAILSLVLSGCSYRSYQEGTAKYTTMSIGTTQAVAPFTIEAGKPNDQSYRKLESKGLSNDPSAAAIEAAVTAAIKAVKP